MSIHHPDHDRYRHFTSRQRVDKAAQTFYGLVKGITIDAQLNVLEVAELLNWTREYADLLGMAPFNELKAKLDEVMVDRHISPEEQEDLLWVCRNMMPQSDFYDQITRSIQQLHGIMHGIMADGAITLDEASGLQDWIDEHECLKGTYPYDELESLLAAVLKDHKIDAEEQRVLKQFFESFVDYSFAKKVSDEAKRVRSNRPTKEFTLPGICAMCPDISFPGRNFTFTGTSHRATRKQIAQQIIALGATFAPNVCERTQYLVVGAAGNPCWAFSCYGRKVEKAVEMRRAGVPIVIVHENDFWDAVEDAPKFSS